MNKKQKAERLVQDRNFAKTHPEKGGEDKVKIYNPSIQSVEFDLVTNNICVIDKVRCPALSSELY